MHRQKGSLRANRQRPGKLIQELHGDVDLKRGNFRQPDPQEKPNQASPSDSQTQPQRDNLSSSDKRSLGELIDSLVP